MRNLFIIASLLVALVSPALSDAPFEQVRTHLKWSHQNSDPDQPGKYFHEATFSEHYDGRFAERQLHYEDRNAHLTALCQSYLATMNDLGIETWLMHGSLLGWYWNRKILPWDADIDVMVSEKSLWHLAQGYNMTLYKHRVAAAAAPGKAKAGPREYLLEVNPHFAESGEDSVNRIDARWIDTDTGLFIDITTLRRDLTAEALGEEGAMMVKDSHRYAYDDIYPLRESEFEDYPVRIPYAYGDLLIAEYGEEALADVTYQDHRFDIDQKLWVAKMYDTGP